MHGEARASHPLQQFQHGHVAEGLSRASARKHETILVVATGGDSFDNCERPIRQGHAVVFAGLHALGRYDPDFVFRVDFASFGADGFAGACRRQDRDSSARAATPSCSRN